MGKKRNQFDGIAAIFFLIGVILIVMNKNSNMVNTGWVLIVIGIVKQIVEWK